MIYLNLKQTTSIFSVRDGYRQLHRGFQFDTSARSAPIFFGTPWNSLEPPVGGTKGPQGVPQDSRGFKLFSIVQLKFL